MQRVCIDFPLPDFFLIAHGLLLSASSYFGGNTPHPDQFKSGRFIFSMTLSASESPLFDIMNPPALVFSRAISSSSADYESSSERKTPDRTNRILSGAGCANFGMCPHWDSPRRKFDGWKKQLFESQTISRPNVKKNSGKRMPRAIFAGSV